MFEYFYNEIIRSVIIGFGSLFNSIEIQHKDNSGNVESVIKVPLAYGPTQKFLARLRQQANLNRATEITLPRMSFEMTGLTYDRSRKSTQMTKIINQTPDGEQVMRNYMPVPYNMTFELSIMTKLNDDMLQIVEQILPYFQPHYNLNINFLGNLKEQRDIPIQLDSIGMTDDYEGNFDTRRALVYTLNFTAKAYIYGPTTDVSGEVIKKVSVGYVAGSPGDGSAERDLTYSVTPRAVKDYDGDSTTILAENVSLTDTTITVDDGSVLSEETYIYVDQEEIYIESIDGNDLRVRRGQDNTKAQKHVLGAAVNVITSADDAEILFGDDFGFNGEIS